jgi:hypothetical protein
VQKLPVETLGTSRVIRTGRSRLDAGLRPSHADGAWHGYCDQEGATSVTQPKEFDMTTRNMHLSALAAAALAATMTLAGCDQPSGSDSAATPPPPRTADKLATTTEDAVAKMPDATDDAAVTTKVKTALLAEPGLRSLEIHVDTKDGVVTLSGTPDSVTSRNRAKEVALGVAGVKSVVDQMSTKS